MSARVEWLLILTVLLSSYCVGQKVLLVFPLPGRSHSSLGQSLAEILVDDGYEVTFVTAFPKNVTKARLTYVDLSSVVGEVAASERLNLWKLAQFPRPEHKILQIGASFNARALRHNVLQALLTDTTLKYDIVIAEWFYSGLLAPLAALWECPLVWYSAQDINWQLTRLIHAPSSSAYTAEINGRHAPRQPYTMLDRAQQLATQIYLSAWTFYQTWMVEEPLYRELFSEAWRVRGRSPPQYNQLVLNASLLLLNSYPPVGQRMPLPPAAKYVGGHHIQKTTSILPPDLQRLLDDAKHGVILFSMGSNIRSSDFPENVKLELARALGRLEQTVLWKLEEPLSYLPDNVHAVDWVPQAAVLNHKNTVMFITHGGMLSLLEATHYGVPLVGVPLFGDQFVNMDLVAQRGCGIRVDVSEDLARDIILAVNEILSNFSYQECARESMTVFSRRGSEGAREEVIRWVREVIETRGAEHLRSPALQLSVLELYHVDILVAASAILWLLSKVVKVIRAHLRTQPIPEGKKYQ